MYPINLFCFSLISVGCPALNPGTFGKQPKALRRKVGEISLIKLTISDCPNLEIRSFASWLYW